MAAKFDKQMRANAELSGVARGGLGGLGPPPIKCEKKCTYAYNTYIRIVELFTDWLSRSE